MWLLLYMQPIHNSRKVLCELLSGSFYLFSGQNHPLFLPSLQTFCVVKKEETNYVKNCNIVYSAVLKQLHVLQGGEGECLLSAFASFHLVFKYFSVAEENKMKS